MKTIIFERKIRNAKKEEITLELEVTGGQPARFVPYEFMVKIINATAPVEFAGVNTAYVSDGINMQPLSKAESTEDNQCIKIGFGEIKRETTDQIVLYRRGAARTKKERFFLFLSGNLYPEDFKRLFKERPENDLQ